MSGKSSLPSFFQSYFLFQFSSPFLSHNTNTCPFHTKGLVAHYYDFVRPNTAIELNRCLHNTMVDNPRDKEGHCRNGAKECEDCRSRNIDDIYSAHFTICQKPWICPHTSPYPTLCANLHRQWFQARKELEMSRGTFTEKKGKHDPNVFLGYCESPMSRGYIPIQIA